MGKLREIKCRNCGESVKIPLFWMLGLEGVFYCGACRSYFRIDYRLGALFAGLGWALSLVTVNLMNYFTSAVTLTLSVIAFVPLGIFYSFVLRRAMLVKCGGKRRTPK